MNARRRFIGMLLAGFGSLAIGELRTSAPRKTLRPTSSSLIIGIGNSGVNICAGLDKRIGAADLVSSDNFGCLIHSAASWTHAHDLPLPRMPEVCAAAFGALPREQAMMAVMMHIAFEALLSDRDRLFLVGGLGGHTGTMALPILAEAASRRGVSVHAFLVKSFSFEERWAKNETQLAYRSLCQLTDSLYLHDMEAGCDPDTAMERVFSNADEAIRQSLLATLFNDMAGTGCELI